MRPTFTNDDMLTVRRALEAYITYLKAFNFDNSDQGKTRETARAEDLYNRIGEIVVP